jgi:hypothetical protein
MKKLLLIVFCLLLVGQVFAVVDPDDDMMGLYFDIQADEFCAEGVGPYTLIPMNLILTRPTMDTIFGFEAGCDMVGLGMVLSHLIIPPGGIIMLPWDNLIVGFSEPYPTSTSTLLVTYQVFYMDTGMGPLSFFLHGTSPSSLDPAYPAVLLPGGVIQSMGISAQEGPTAQINGDCAVVSTQKMNFDGIKSLYR